MKVVENEAQFNAFLEDLKKMDADSFLDTLAACKHCEDSLAFYRKLMGYFEEDSLRRHMLQCAIEVVSDIRETQSNLSSRSR